MNCKNPLTLVLICCLCYNYINAFTQVTDTTLTDHNGNHFYLVSQEDNQHLLIFLHGGVNNPEFDREGVTPELPFLLEGNDLFIPTALSNGYDVLVPVTNDSLNWLTHHAYCFSAISDYLGAQKEYTSTVISGFSDGGTSSYKIFYDNPVKFDGLVVFNGYPQHQNFYLAVDYTVVTDKKVAFFSTYDDDVIPYEFLLTEYSKQKRTNADTYLYIAEGGHSFAHYGAAELAVCFDIVTSRTLNTQTNPIHAFIREDKVVWFYPYRKKVCRKYGYGEDYLEINRAQERTYGQ